MGRSINERPLPLDGTFYHKASNRHYAIAGGVMKRHQVDGEGRRVNEIERTVTLAIGSGNHAITYVHRTAQGRLFELPVSWYAKLRGYEMSPGYERADHFDFRREISEACLFCHSNGRAPTAIGCERCHGSAAAHLAKPGRGNIYVSKSVETCLQCHLETSSSSFLDSLRRPGREVFSYRAGEPLGDYKLYFAPPKDERFEINHAGYRLLQSRCFQESEGRMTCVTCHDPHSARVMANSCQQCHSKPHTQEDCAPCHLPKRAAADAIHVNMTDHRIDRRPHADDTPYAGRLVDFYTRADAISLERANTREPSVEALQRFLSANPADAGLWAALGNALVRAGRPGEAVAALGKASSRDTSAQTYLAVAYAVQGDAKKALEILEKAVADNPDHALAWINLGITHEALGNRAAARAAYDKAVVLQPDSAEARRRRNALLVAEGNGGRNP
jgi:tetratricopeptide (TPR) repeat protein